MNHRHQLPVRSFMMKKITLALAMLLLALNTVTYAQANKGTKPNVLVIAIDDLNDYVTQLRSFPGLKTPNLDKFVKTAVNFNRAYCAAPVCNPSRTAILSGMAPYKSGVYENTNAIINSRPLDSVVYMPEHFKANGYETITRGKIFHTMPPKPRYQAMWDAMGGQGGYGPMPKERNIPLALKAPPMFNYQPWTGPDTDHPDNVTAEYTVGQLAAKHDKPFFITAGLYKPHNPWTAPKQFFDMYPLESVNLPKVLESDWDDLPDMAKEWAKSPADYEALKTSGKWKEVVRAYLACISFMDSNFGKIMDALDKSAYKNNTIVCVFADNGFHLGEKKHFAKFALWEQTTHILHMWRVPGMTRAGAVCSAPVSLLNIYPTLVELCGLSQPASTLDGRSIVPLLKNNAFDWKYPAVTTYMQGGQAIRDKRYRYIHYPDGTEELYDEQTDPNEWSNLAATPAMQSMLKQFRSQVTPNMVPGVKRSGGGEE